MPTNDTPRVSTYSPGLDGVLAGETALCHVDEGEGGLRYRGYAVSDLTDKARFEEVATPPMRAIRNLARAFDGSVPMAKTDPLSVEVVSLGPQSKVFEGDALHPPLWHREVLAVLPFQVSPQKHVVAVYVMTRDAVKPFPPETFRLKFSGVKGSRAEAMDVLTGAPVPLQAKVLGADSLEITLPVTDRPTTIALSK